ncbi:hypothetical protein D3C75_809110 [compost metagenome]
MPPATLRTTSACAYCVSTAETPVAANIPQKNEPLITPAASDNADRRPWFMATPMIRILLGPGLAAPMMYAVKTISRLWTSITFMFSLMNLREVANPRSHAIAQDVAGGY